MLKISKKYSLYLSMGVAAVFLVVCVAGGLFMPRIMETLVRLHDTMHGYATLAAHDIVVLYLVAYTALAIAVLADSLLFVLLLRVRRELVFTHASIALIRAISWCCFLVGLAFAAVGIYFRVAWCVTLLAAFLGLCVRVVKNVIEEATAIKSENDLTV
ncbi:MAG: DUF2975 domain-containing protein [Clostridia bacterium]|nr:DUF2975 domain-containing protein [Clostridia bacterium]